MTSVDSTSLVAMARVGLLFTRSELILKSSAVRGEPSWNSMPSRTFTVHTV